MILTIAVRFSGTMMDWQTRATENACCELSSFRGCNSRRPFLSLMG
jgi:hypothetical protein